MKYVSLFSGIEAATVAWEPLGWENARGCKIEHAAAIAYGLEIHGYELMCCGDAS